MRAEIFLIIIGMGIVTYLPRWFPLLLLSRRPLPHWLADWLDFIPAAILSALVLPSILTVGEPREIEWFRPELWVAFPTFCFAWKTRSLAGTVIVGMGLYWLVSLLV
jgi:branched-subunit amino acid transport protein